MVIDFIQGIRMTRVVDIHTMFIVYTVGIRNDR